MKTLLVDDHPLFRDGLALLLEKLHPGIECRHAGTCEEALNELAACEVDFVLMDIGLPGTSGLDAIAALRAMHADVPIVVLSSHEDKQTVVTAIDRGAMAYITKASSTEVLAAALRLILAGGVYVPAVASGRVANKEKTDSLGTIGLSSRQTDVLRLIVQGKSAKVIARELNISLSTVKTHTSAVLRALNATTRTQAVLAAARLGVPLV